MPVPLPPTHGATPGQLCMIRRTLSAPVPPGPSRATVFRDGGGSLRGGSPWPMLHLSTESCGPALPGSPWPMLHLSTENCGPALPGRCCTYITGELWRSPAASLARRLTAPLSADQSHSFPGDRRPTVPSAAVQSLDRLPGTGPVASEAQNVDSDC